MCPIWSRCKFKVLRPGRIMGAASFSCGIFHGDWVYNRSQTIKYKKTWKISALKNGLVLVGNIRLHILIAHVSNLDNALKYKCEISPIKTKL